MKCPLLTASLLALSLVTACGGTASPPPVASSAAAKPASVTPAGSAAASAKPSGLTKISSFYSTVSPTFAPMWIAKEAGIFAKNGLDVDVQLIQNPQGTAALLSNQVQIGLGGAALPNAIASGFCAVGVGAIGNRHLWSTVPLGERANS